MTDDDTSLAILLVKVIHLESPSHAYLNTKVLRKNRHDVLFDIQYKHCNTNNNRLVMGLLPKIDR